MDSDRGPGSAALSSLGAAIYWIAVIVAGFAAVSVVMSLAMFEGDERYVGALGWAGFAAAALLVGWLSRWLLARHAAGATRRGRHPAD